MTTIFLVLFLSSLVAVYFIVTAQEKKKIAAMSPESRDRLLAERTEAQTASIRGTVNPSLVCPHCQSRGSVRTKFVAQKAGVSGGKATAALLTGGFSLLAVGLSRKQLLTEAYCGVCGSTWHF